ncbi:DNA/RNA non-specific endonuclease [Lactobacillus sp. Sy-1]|uniref:DNA/RNA non-specific endonuclease n=1 Tax=Lactobacillus sp. Sy-1 TaxID=2109645 RepID=UPI001C568D62|nr:DNA/RNA non-specific endonuclease [Lactobacillus sp. Sy-1]
MKKLWALMTTAVVAVTLAGCSTNTNHGQSQSTSQQITATQLPDLTYTVGKQAYVEVNGGKSTLNPDSWKQNRIQYADLDSHNRTSAANTAYLEKRNVADGALRTRQTVYPTGWHQKFVNNDAIINRGHLIAYSLSKGINTDGQYEANLKSGDQNNLKNLFTQSAFSNQKLQTIYETLVRNALKENKRVIYQVQPVFKGSDLMARGVHLQAISTDKKLNFNVYLFNVQPGIQFDYASGRSKVDNSMNVPAPASVSYYNGNQRHHSSVGAILGAYGAYKTYQHYQKRKTESSYHSQRTYRTHRTYQPHYRTFRHR